MPESILPRCETGGLDACPFAASALHMYIAQGSGDADAKVRPITQACQEACKSALFQTPAGQRVLAEAGGCYYGAERLIANSVENS